MITLDNYEEYLIDYLHGELPESGIQEIEKFMSEHDAVRHEYELLKQTIFTPEADIHYPDKHLLIKPVKLSLFIKYKKQLAAAAMIAGLILSVLLLLQKTGKQAISDSEAKVEKVEEQKSVILPEVEPPHISDYDSSTVSAEQIVRTPQKKQGIIPLITSPKKIIEKQNVPEQKNSENIAKEKEPALDINEKQTEEMPVVKAAKDESLKPEKQTDLIPLNNEAPAVVKSPAAKNTFELDKQKQPKLFRAIAQVVKFSRKVKAKKETLTNTEITVIVGNRKIFNLN